MMCLLHHCCVIDRPNTSTLARGAVTELVSSAELAFRRMLDGWSTQQASRGLRSSTIESRRSCVRRLFEFTGAYPWDWGPSDLEEFTTRLLNGPKPVALSTARHYQEAISLFCTYASSRDYGWPQVLEDAFGRGVTQICTPWNSVKHVTDFEGRATRRPFSYDELQTFFDAADSRFQDSARHRSKGALAALRDAQIFKTTYAFGLRRREVVSLELSDLHHSSTVPQWGRFAALHVRFAKAAGGGPPRRRTVLAVPEFSWAIDGLRYWVEDCRPLFRVSPHLSTLWPTERGTAVSPRYVDTRFAAIRDEAGLDRSLTLHSLRHSYVTHLVEFGYAERFVQEQVGHRHASTTTIYTAVSDDYKRRVINAALTRLTKEMDR